MPKKTEKKDITIRSSAAEYLTFVAATGDDKNSVEVRYEDENIWITQKMLATLYEFEGITSFFVIFISIGKITLINSAVFLPLYFADNML